jgi:purine-binding chemotaxis protein CheW
MKQSTIDWEQVRQRLRATDRALENLLGESTERIESVYRQRAVRLALKPAEDKNTFTSLPVLVFRLARERYAIELKELTDVLRFDRCTPVPGGSPHFAGVINVRGQLRAVLNLRHLIGPSEGESSDSGFVLLLRRLGREIGLKVDRIEELRDIHPEELTLPVCGKYLKGVVSGTLMLLSVDAVLAEAFSANEYLAT